MLDYKIKSYFNVVLSIDLFYFIYGDWLGNVVIHATSDLLLIIKESLMCRTTNNKTILNFPFLDFLLEQPTCL